MNGMVSTLTRIGNKWKSSFSGIVLAVMHVFDCGARVIFKKGKLQDVKIMSL